MVDCLPSCSERVEITSSAGLQELPSRAVAVSTFAAKADVQMRQLVEIQVIFTTITMFEGYRPLDGSGIASLARRLLQTSPPALKQHFLVRNWLWSRVSANLGYVQFWAFGYRHRHALRCRKCRHFA